MATKMAHFGRQGEDGADVVMTELRLDVQRDAVVVVVSPSAGQTGARSLAT